MLRWILVAILVLAVCALLLGSGLLPRPAAALVRSVFHFGVFVIAPIFLVMFLLAPGLFPRLADEARALWQRFSRRETAELQQRIEQLDKPHHMVQLGNVYFRAARYGKAASWFAKALARDESLLEARYRLGACAFHTGELARAVELMEEVHAEKPDYDYGMAYLRLAQGHARRDNNVRAEEVFQTMLRYYPGHAEASYSYGQLLASENRWSAAREQMQNVLKALRQSPTFQRRRNRHWGIKAWWWLFRHGKRSDRSGDDSEESSRLPTSSEPRSK